MAAKQPVWDLPTRLFHWLLVALVGLSWWSAETHRLDLHLWTGLAVLFLIAFRLAWGLVGGSTARFAGFVRGPRAVVAYLRDVKGWRGIGHSPLGALSVMALLGAIAVQVGLGLFSADEDGFAQGPLANAVSRGLGETLTELHEEWFTVVKVVVALHVAAILFYRLRYGKKLTSAMVTGKGEVPTGAAMLKRASLVALAAALAVAGGFTWWVSAGAPPLGG